MTDFFQPDPGIPPRILASDLDGTLIPLPGVARNRESLEILTQETKSRQIPILFATGRRFDSVMEAIEESRLPRPDWIVCDVGTSVYRGENEGYHCFEPYAAHLEAKIGDWNRPEVEARMLEMDGVFLQDPMHQQTFKVSFHCAADRVETAVVEMGEACAAAGLRLAALGSVDPFENRGLIDLLPVGVNKAYALVWLATHADFRPEEVVFSGDSGNDLAALVSGFRATVVGNASAALRQEIDRLAKARGLEGRIYHAESTATSGVLEGARHHGLIPLE